MSSGIIMTPRKIHSHAKECLYNNYLSNTISFASCIAPDLYLHISAIMCDVICNSILRADYVAIHNHDEYICAVSQKGADYWFQNRQTLRDHVAFYQDNYS